MNPLKTKEGRPHRCARDWPYSTYLTITRLHGRGVPPGDIARTVGLTWGQVRAFIDACLLSPVGGYADLKRRICADLDAEDALRAQGVR